MRTIRQGEGTYYQLHDNGNISKKGAETSGNWKITGAVRYNNFGHEVERVTLQELLAGKIKHNEWKHKNGKQKWFICDLDHGTHRVWGNPGHVMYGA